MLHYKSIGQPPMSLVEPKPIEIAMAVNTARDSFRARSRKVKAPTFRIGIGEVYRELERQGKIPAEGIEKKAQYEEEKENARQRKGENLFSRFGGWLSDQFE